MTFIVLASSLIYNRSLASTPLRVQDLQSVGLAGVQRLLVIAPHPDDETLGAGGLIQAAVGAGIEVQIVVVTNGDGQWAAPIVLRGQVRPRPEDYVAMGNTRQAETLAVVQQLGVAPSQLRFLGYPDGGLEQLWRDDWATACPLRARWTRTTASPYATTYDPTDHYCGRDLLRSITAVVTAYRPDLVVVPHPHDDHPDHRATAAFARLALALVQHDEADYAPVVWSYPVHHGDFPQPRGWRTRQPLLPPTPLLFAGTHWRRFDLSPHQVQVKGAAVRLYVSQAQLLGSFLPSFVRSNELFEVLPLTDAPRLEWAAVGELGPLAWHTIAEPARESTRRLLIEGADLVEFQVARAGDQVWLTALTRGKLVPGLHYQILVKTPSGEMLVLALPTLATRVGRSGFSAELDLAALGHPAVIAVAAEVRQGATLDRTAWHLIAFGQASEEPAPGPDA